MFLSKHLGGIVWIQSPFRSTNYLVVVGSGDSHPDYLDMNLSFAVY